jgi:hypothetical protein
MRRVLGKAALLTPKKWLGVAPIAFFAGAIFGSSVLAEEKFQKLNGAQIRAKFAGMELTDEVHWYDLYERDGTASSSYMGRTRDGKWWVEKNQLCVELDKEEPVKCYDVRLSGNKVQMRAEGLLPMDAVLRSPLGRR